MLSTLYITRFVVRLIVICKCSRTERYLKICICCIINNLLSNNLQIFREKSRIFCDSIKISLDKICYKEFLNNLRQFNKKDVTILLDFFCSKNCLRLNSEHYVSALISRSAISWDLYSEKELLRFNLEHSVICLHERYCLKATRNFFAEDNNR